MDMSLTEKERKELELLDNPNVQFLSPAFGGPLLALFGKYGNRRKARVVQLRTKMRMGKLGLDPKKDHQKYSQIIAQEEDRFDKRFEGK